MQQLSGDGYPSANDVAVDRDGAIVVVGSFARRLSLAGTELTGAGGDDAFVAKLTADGHLVWARSFGGPGTDAVHAVATTPDGDILVAGSFHQSLDVGGTVLTAVSGPDAFVARLAPDGATRWARAFGGTGTATPRGLAVAPSGAAIVAGFFDEGLDAGGPEPLESAGLQDAFAVALAADGTTIWARAWGGDSTDAAESLAVTSRGDVVVTGYFRKVASLGAIDLTSASDQTDAFLAVLAGADGTPRWAKRFGGAGQDAGHAVAVDGSDAIVLAAGFDAPALFGGSPLEPAGELDVLVGKYDADGNPIWAVQLGGDGNESVRDLAIAGPAILLAGDFEGRAAFGGAPLVSAGRHDGFVAKLTGAGVTLWTRGLSGEGQDQLSAVVGLSDGALAAVGSFQGSAELGDRKLEAPGLHELVLLRLTP